MTHNQAQSEKKPVNSHAINLHELADKIQAWGLELGFDHIGITDTHLGKHADYFKTWLEANHHADMEYMERHRELRCNPDQLHSNTIRIITARMNYLPPAVESVKILKQSEKAYISRYALGRDYHKLIRKRLTSLAKKIQEYIGEFGYRAFVDSAPVLERAFAEKSGQGWIGKNTMVLNRQAGSWFFLGELFTDLPLPVTGVEQKSHCGRCQACLDICPTKAFVAPYQLDARRCISYLTIENKGPIPLELRPLMGNRIYGCDDCQLACPWNRFAKLTQEGDFHPRHNLDSSNLVDLFLWDEETFLKQTEGSAIRRTGFEGWLRNIAVGLGNAKTSPEIIKALLARIDYPSELVQEHIHWALQQHDYEVPSL